MKIVNSEKKSDYTVRKWGDAAYKRFEMVDDKDWPSKVDKSRALKGI